MNKLRDAALLLGWSAITLFLEHIQWIVSWVQSIELTLKKEIAYSDFINVAIALGISFYLPYAVGRAIDKKNSTKTLVIHACTELQMEIKRTFDELTELAREDWTVLFQRLKILDHLLDRVIKRVNKEYAAINTLKLKARGRAFRSSTGDDVRTAWFQADAAWVNKSLLAYKGFYDEVEIMKFAVNDI